MRARKVDMQRKAIEHQRDQLLREIEALKNKVAGLEMALSLLGNEGAAQLDRSPKQRGGLKQILSDLLREAGTTGLNAATAVEVAQRRGTHLDRQSVSSTLSRMKAEGVVDYNGERYRLIEFTSAVEGGGAADVLPFRSAS